MSNFLIDFKWILMDKLFFLKTLSSFMDLVCSLNTLGASHRICMPLMSSDFFSLKVFISVQSLSRVWLFATSWTAARQASLSITNSRSLPKLMSIESVMPTSHLILCRPLLLPPSSIHLLYLKCYLSSNNSGMVTFLFTTFYLLPLYFKLLPISSSSWHYINCLLPEFSHIQI